MYYPKAKLKSIQNNVRFVQKQAFKAKTFSKHTVRGIKIAIWVMDNLS